MALRGFAKNSLKLFNLLEHFLGFITKSQRVIAEKVDESANSNEAILGREPLGRR